MISEELDRGYPYILMRCTSWVRKERHVVKGAYLTKPLNRLNHDPFKECSMRKVFAEV